MDIREHVIALNEKRARAWEHGKNLLDEVAGRAMSAEETQKWDRINAEIDDIDAQVRSFVERETREVEAAKLREGFDGFNRDNPTPAAPQTRSERDEFYSWVKGEKRGFTGRIGDGADQEAVRNGYVVDLEPGRHVVEAARSGAGEKELRSLLWDTGSSGSLVPTELSSQLYAFMTASVAVMNMPTTKIMTDSGNPLEFPRVNAHGIGTQVIAQGTAIGGTDPTFLKMTLNSFKYGQLLQLASETIQDAGVDILSFVASNTARAVGEVVATDLAVGTGSGEPQGVVSAIAGAGTIASGGSLIGPTYEKLVDLVYSVNGNYRQRPSTAFLMRDLTVAAVRKLRDGAGGTLGASLWVPSLVQGIQGAEPDRLLGYPVWTDPNVASMASNAVTIEFGDFSAYYVRIAKSFVLDRSDEFAFNTDLVTFRAKTRVDGDLIDATALNVMKQSV